MFSSNRTARPFLDLVVLNEFVFGQSDAFITEQIYIVFPQKWPKCAPIRTFSIILTWKIAFEDATLAAVKTSKKSHILTWPILERELYEVHIERVLAFMFTFVQLYAAFDRCQWDVCKLRHCVGPTGVKTTPITPMEQLSDELRSQYANGIDPMPL